jgi:hypothetical protein
MKDLKGRIEDVLYDHHPWAYTNDLGYPEVEWDVTEVVDALLKVIDPKPSTVEGRDD